MPDLAEPLARMVEEFRRLPGVGAKSAQRMAFYVLRASVDDAHRLAQAIIDVKEKLGLFQQGFRVTSKPERLTEWVSLVMPLAHLKKQRHFTTSLRRFSQTKQL